MSQMVLNQSGRLEFAYENDAAASFLVIKCDTDVLEYQAIMLGHNRIHHVIPVDVIRKEGVTCFYYNITSRISLAFYLNRQKLDRQAFLKMLLNIASAVNEAGGYLLTDSNFVFDPEYIYINPETLEPDLIYIPAVMRDGGGGLMAAFISELMLRHVNVDGFDSGNFVQRILASAKSEVFNNKEFIILLNELLYGQDTRPPGITGQGRNKDDWPARQDIRGIQEPDNFKVKQDHKNANNLREMPDTKSNKEKKDFLVRIWNKKEAKKVNYDRIMKKVNKTGWIPALAVLVQMIMGSAIYLCRGFLAGIGDDPLATYVAVAMVVLAVEVFLFKKLKDARADISGTARDLSDARVSGFEAARDLGNARVSSFDAAKKLNDARADISGTARDLSDARVNSFVAVRKLNDTEVRADVQSESAYKIPAPEPEPNIGSKTERDCAGAFGYAHRYPDSKADKKGLIADCSTESPDNNICKTELLGYHTRGVRVLKATGSHGGEDDIYIDKDDFIIGRLPGYVDHVLMNNAVGKLHAQLICRNGACYVRDLNSVNGTFINNCRIESNKDMELKNNDKLQLANNEFVFINS